MRPVGDRLVSGCELRVLESDLVYIVLVLSYLQSIKSVLFQFHLFAFVFAYMADIFRCVAPALVKLNLIFIIPLLNRHRVPFLQLIFLVHFGERVIVRRDY